MMELVIALLVFLAFALLLRAYFRMKARLAQAVSSRQSLSVKYGKMSEQFMPFLKTYPYDEQNFRFIGTPVDGVQFNDDSIVFVEFKTSKSRMSPRQRMIKELIDSKKVRFEEIRIDA
ncbi:MAG: endonuclease [Candidatus Aenigmarchaeota archaeon]|nr:endonuclease [Candidatus Aenigmarchaeota archaeon]